MRCGKSNPVRLKNDAEEKKEEEKELIPNNDNDEVSCCHLSQRSAHVSPDPLHRSVWREKGEREEQERIIDEELSSPFSTTRLGSLFSFLSVYRSLHFLMCFLMSFE